MRWIKINATPIFFNQEKKPSFVVTSFNDVSSFLKAEKERKSLEAKLTESARLTSLGEMASGIAHEINNPLAIIKGKIHNLKTKLEKEDKTDKDELISHLNVVSLTVDRIAKIIKGLRAFSRNAENDPFEKVVFSYVVNEAFDLSREKVKKLGIDLKVEVNENLLVECRPVQIGQVIVNLINNSIDAVSKIENKWISIVVSENKGLVRILFKDSGSGINEKVAGKMMDPFFTTKEVGKGTGLGLIKV
jgi:C4-dicarboxylate-specific signal transduction histidine kinase